MAISLVYQTLFTWEFERILDLGTSYSGPESRLDLLELGRDNDSGAVKELAELLGVSGCPIPASGRGMS